MSSTTLTFIAPLAVWFLGINPATSQSTRPQLNQSVWASLRDGARLFTGGGQAGALMALMIPTSFAFSGGTLSLFIYLGREIFEASPSTVGVCLAIANVGALAGSALATVSHQWRLRTLTLISLWVCVFGLLLTGGASTFWLATAALAIVSTFESIIEVAVEMVLFSSIPVEYIGRAAGLMRVAQGIPCVAAPVTIGLLSPYVDVPLMFALLAAVCLVPLAWLLWNKSALANPREEEELRAA